MVELKDYQTYREQSLSFNKFLSKVFLLVFVGLMISSVTCFLTYLALLRNFALANFSFVVMLIQMGIAIYFQTRLNHMSKQQAYLCFGIYAATLGVTLGYIPIFYNGKTIVIAVLMTALLFGSMAIIGHTTNIDLSRFSSIFSVGLLMLVVTSVINFFVRSSGLDMILNYAGIILFLGIVAWDMQRMRQVYLYCRDDHETFLKMSILMAFELFLDFVNIFLRLLPMFDSNNDN